ncbi:MAG: selenide, water dikinase SelD [Gammaproteobacteria bacterium]|jgi:selenide,water dikinase
MQTMPVLKDLVLVGGGHSHVEVLKRFGMRPEPGVRLTVISRDVHTPYSGMLPGLIAGHYTFDEAHIDLGPLANFAQARLYHDEVTAIDPDRRRLICRGRPPVRYDVVSIDVGSAPDTRVPGSAEETIPVKPVSNFTRRWDAARARILAVDSPQRIGVVGGGAGGLELLLSIRHHLHTVLAQDGRDAERLSFHLIAASDQLLPTHNARARAKFMQLTARCGIELTLGERVVAANAEGVRTAERAIALDEVFWVTNASAPQWLADGGLATDDAGFIRVHPTLQSVSHTTVFAAGDIAAVAAYPRPKSGVFAVRQGPPLAENLRRALREQALKPFKPQTDFLSLISTGERYAIGSRGKFAFAGRWAWHWKDRIDRRFMRNYAEFPDMPAPAPVPMHGALATLNEALQADPMRCGGCGSKVGANILRDALANLEQPGHDDVLVGLGAPDDAAVVVPKPGMVLVQTVDSFRAFIDDPYVFGQIAANHCLSDIFAMGATPQTALAIVTLPLAAAAKMRDDLTQLMAGAATVFAAEHTAIVGGHTNEGAEMSLGFAVNGYIDADHVNRKGDAQPGDVLIATKALGTGILFAGDMRGKAKRRWVEAALASMLQSNARAANVLRDHGAQALTDVTGFGLFGHLAEMLRAAKCSARIVLDELQLLDGVTNLAAAGVRSSLDAHNRAVDILISPAQTHDGDPRYIAGFDPQTAGGLLASVPPARADACVQALRDAGYTAAGVIGSVVAASAVNGESGIELV